WLRNFGRCPHPSHRRPRVLSGRLVSTERAWLVDAQPLEALQCGKIRGLHQAGAAEAHDFSGTGIPGGCLLPRRFVVSTRLPESADIGIAQIEGAPTVRSGRSALCRLPDPAEILLQKPAHSALQAAPVKWHLRK